jgi:class 3 adenylate cyclase
MSLKDELENEVKAIFEPLWTTRLGQVVPAEDDIGLANDAVEFEEAVVLYADLADSTELVQGQADWFAAEIYKTFLHCASKIIKSNDGVITAFDGDRIMAVFIGKTKRTNAARTALKINGAVEEIIKPAMQARYPSSTYEVRHSVGVDMSKLFVARTGVRGANDLVWVGQAANYAAKLSGVRDGDYRSFITAPVYKLMADESKYETPGTNDMWESWWWEERSLLVYRSRWLWVP